MVDSTDEFARRVQAELDHRELSHWKIFAIDIRHGVFAHIDRDLKRMDEADAVWQPHLTGSPRPLVELAGLAREPRTSSAGVLHIVRSRVMLVRWKIFVVEQMCWGDVELIAAPCQEDVIALIDRMRSLREKKGKPQWTVTPNAYCEEELDIDRTDTGGLDRLELSDAVRRRLNREVIGFFDPETAELYDRLGMPRRRGILFHGPPGCGKTSICKAIGAALPDVNAFILNIGARFDTDDLRMVFQEVMKSAPSLLVMEDVDLLLECPDISVSVFLNMLDGIVPTRGDGVMVLATTNHPQNLVGALNNRPGRFATIEIPPPSVAQRERYLQRHLPDMPEGVIHQVASSTHDHSFAHLHEIVFLSGAYALETGSGDRTPESVIEAADVVHASVMQAQSGFSSTGRSDFGFAATK